MINKPLYNRLLKVFKDVIVEHEDQRPVIRQTQGIKREVKPYTIVNSGETYRVRCPVCEDHSHHCYISSLTYSSPVVDGVQLKPFGVIAKCFRRDCFKSREAREVLNSMLRCDGLSLDLSAAEEVDFEDVTAKTAPTNAMTLESFRQWQPDYHTFDAAPEEVLEYISSRGITKEQIDRLHIGWGKCWNARSGSYINDHNWIQFPIFDQLGLRGFQSRQLIDSKMKYYFDYRTPKKFCLYNRADACSYPIVGICEGVVDALHIGRCGMAFFGYKPSEAQKRLIQQDGANMVLYFPDQKMSKDLNPVKEADAVIREWSKQYQFPWGIHRIDVPGPDAGECTYDDIWVAAYEQLTKKNINTAILEALENQILRMK